MSGVFSPPRALADQLTVARAAVVPLAVVLTSGASAGHDYWATAFCGVAMATDRLDGRLAHRSGRSSGLGPLLDPMPTSRTPLDYPRLALRLLRGVPADAARTGAPAADSTLSSSPASRQMLP